MSSTNYEGASSMPPPMHQLAIPEEPPTYPGVVFNGPVNIVGAPTIASGPLTIYRDGAVHKDYHFYRGSTHYETNNTINVNQGGDIESVQTTNSVSSTGSTPATTPNESSTGFTLEGQGDSMVVDGKAQN
ncbi:hypothetical protein CC1G_04723 [Coprinopsis cinerea okayama7|uniref:Uncharacterized protein n=1 Tax=Coprinopsis cinerea (strain Okayama-7 / 130 / ATCC MYA-4618 / FGSC 9003) TaxID=240176 RepID=A8P2B6_COPC7|nr:hypothetical protein CC1G_04723 [Coprinopsis cinerea okayama7\|eukprot:XP_001838279.2 hypothetical protein CC1G_04723 [Coprinopsis cinerea okayama7\